LPQTGRRIAVLIGGFRAGSKPADAADSSARLTRAVYQTLNRFSTVMNFAFFAAFDRPQENLVSEIRMLKNRRTTTLGFCASEGVQISGGAGFMRGAEVERIYREVKINAIGAGTEEIMKDLASRQMGL
jgi:alkylation response protein AidB-like acyl-CoA dehydrogenase